MRPVAVLVTLGLLGGACSNGGGSNGDSDSGSEGTSGGSTGDGSDGPTGSTTDDASGSSSSGGPDLPDLGEGPHAFRMDEIYIRDPHIFVDAAILGCHDFTEFGLLTLGSLNEQLNDSLTMDLGPDAMPDGILDLNLMLVFRPYDPTAAIGQLDVVSGSCTAPIESTACTPLPNDPVNTADFMRMTEGSCLAADPADLNDMYDPAPSDTPSPCLVAGPVNLSLSVQGITIPLDGASIAAQPTPMVEGMVEGLIRGFLSVETAEATALPTSLPLVGGMPMATLLPGGMGNCAPHDDLDERDGVPGWWFHLNFEATRVPYSEP